MGLLLIVLGLLLWLLAGWFVVGIVLIVLGVVLLIAWDYPHYGPGRRAP